MHFAISFGFIKDCFDEIGKIGRGFYSSHDDDERSVGVWACE